MHLIETEANKKTCILCGAESDESLCKPCGGSILIICNSYSIYRQILIENKLPMSQCYYIYNAEHLKGRRKEDNLLVIDEDWAEYLSHSGQYDRLEAIDLAVAQGIRTINLLDLDNFDRL